MSLEQMVTFNTKLKKLLEDCALFVLYSIFDNGPTDRTLLEIIIYLCRAVEDQSSGILLD